MFHNIVTKPVKEWEVPFGASPDKESEMFGQKNHIVALYPQVIRTQEEYTNVRQSVSDTGFDISVHYCVLVTPGDANKPADDNGQPAEHYLVVASRDLPKDIDEARALGAKYDVALAWMNTQGLSISQLTLPHDNRRQWVISQLERVYAEADVSRRNIEDFLTGALPVITVAVYDEKIVAAGMAKVSAGAKSGIWNYISILGPAANPPHNNNEWYPAVWGEMVHELVRKFFVS